MRTDVKVGIALGALILIVAVSYYGTRDHSEIQLADSGAAAREHNAKVLDELLTPRQPARRTTRTKPAQENTPAHSPSRRGRASSGDQRAGSGASAEGSARPVESRPRVTPSLRPAQQPSASPPPPRSQVSQQAEQAPAVSLPAASPPAGTALQEVDRGRKQDAAQGAPPLTLQGRTPRAEPKPPPPSQPSPGRSRQHVVQAGESFASIAEHYYGHQRYARVLAAANPEVDPRGMKIGSSIEVPPLPAADSAATGRTRRAAPPANAYQVKPGDTLYEIARTKLGSASRWREIYELNKETIGEDPAKIQAGQMLDMPQR